jgi:hypothetical protein
MRWKPMVAVLALAAACSSVHPVAVQVGDRCFRCRRAIGDTKLAAEMISPQGAPFPFRTSGCLARYLQQHPTEGGVTYVADYKSGRLIPSDEAWFVPTMLGEGNEKQPDYFAFRSRADADEANTARVPLLRWKDVLDLAPAH